MSELWSENGHALLIGGGGGKRWRARTHITSGEARSPLTHWVLLLDHIKMWSGTRLMKIHSKSNSILFNYLKINDYMKSFVAKRVKRHFFLGKGHHHNMIIQDNAFRLIPLLVIQCVPIKRKPVLSVRYLHCHARLKQTVCFIITSIFSSFSWYQTHNDISMHEWKGTI